MKNIWIYNSMDGPAYFSNPKKAYNTAIRFSDKKPKYSTVLNHLKNESVYEFNDNDTSIVKSKVL